MQPRVLGFETSSVCHRRRADGSGRHGDRAARSGAGAGAAALAEGDRHWGARRAAAPDAVGSMAPNERVAAANAQLAAFTAQLSPASAAPTVAALLARQVWPPRSG